MSDDPRALKLYIDGNCYKNPGGAGAIACVAKFPDDWNKPDEVIFEEGFHKTTNNRMELCACIGALEYITEHRRVLGVERVLIVTDSLYVYENQRRAALWRSTKWSNSTGRPIENFDLWKRFLSVRNTGINTEIVWEKGKKSPILKMVDHAAKTAGRSPRRFDHGFRAGKVARSKVKGGSSSMLVANGQKATIRIYRSAIIRKTAHKITFDLFDDVSRQYIQKSHAYADAEVAGDLHRQHCYRVKFGENPKHPMIEEILQELPCSSLEPLP